jgi:signal transduction histidine kinase
MGPSKQQHRLIAEVSHQVNSPLAAIRNALYLAAQRTNDTELLRYLQLADEEVTAITSRIRQLREDIEQGFLPVMQRNAAPEVQRMRKAA